MEELYKITITFDDKNNQHEEIADKIGKLLEDCGIEEDIIVGLPYKEETNNVG